MSDSAIKDLMAVLPDYKNIKIVKAAKIVRVQPSNDMGAFLHLQTSNGETSLKVDAETFHRRGFRQGGYLIIYQDGYLSYRPAHVFTAGYVPNIDAPKLPTRLKLREEALAANDKHVFSRESMIWLRAESHCNLFDLSMAPDDVARTRLTKADVLKDTVYIDKILLLIEDGESRHITQMSLESRIPLSPQSLENTSCLVIDREITGTFTFSGDENPIRLKIKGDLDRRTGDLNMGFQCVFRYWRAIGYTLEAHI